MITKTARSIFQAYPIIAAVRTPEDYERAFESKVRILSMVGDDIFKVEKHILKAKDKGLLVLLRMDLVEGLGKDESGIRYAKERLGVDGIHSAKLYISKIAKKERMITIHRVFVNDFRGYKSGMSQVESIKPDFVDLTPGIIPRMVRKASQDYPYPVIASGLVSTENDVKTLMEAGASNFVCSTQKLWWL